jgi:WD40 repeat protein
MTAGTQVPGLPADTGAVDPENPWPGLASFHEADQELFHGRDAETDELARLVLRERVAVLYGLSGLGKTSLLQAGLFPRLRRENVLPVYLRLDLSSAGPAPADQIRDAVREAARAAEIEAPELRAGDTLWESFHRQGAEFWTARNRPVTPLLVFDQFEEIFTLGRRDRAAALRTEAFLDDLAALTEGAPPAAVRARVDADPSAAAEYSFSRHAYKILFSLREDFLPELEGLRRRIRAVVPNRFRLQRMKGPQALAAIIQAGGHLVEADVAELVVRFVAAGEDAETPLADLEIEPALLSVVCRELNNERRRQGLPRITAALLQGGREEILTDFYERGLADQPAEVRTFIEEHLLTKSGFRDSVALDNALALPGVDEDAIRTLTDRRLLRVEDRGGMQRVELTHDVLAGVVRRSRDARREREERLRLEAARREAEARERQARRTLRRSWLVTALLSLLLVGVIVLAVWVKQEEGKTRKVLARVDVEKATHALSDGHNAEALAYLAHAVRTDPDEPSARAWLVSLLLRKGWLLLRCEIPPAQEWAAQPVSHLTPSPDGRFVVATYDQAPARLFDLQACREIRLQGGQPRFRHAFFSQRGDVLVGDQTGKNENTASRWDTATGRPLGRPIALADLISSITPDARWLLVGWMKFATRVVDAQTGRVALTRPFGTYLAHFNPAGDELLLASGPQLLSFHLKTGALKTLGSPDPKRDITMIRGLSADGKLLLVDLAHQRCVYDLASKQLRELPPMNWELSRDGTLLIDEKSRKVLDPRKGGQEDVQEISTSSPLWRDLHPAGLTLDLSAPSLENGPQRLRLLNDGGEVEQVLEDVSAAALLPGRLELVTSSQDGTLDLWSPARQALPERIQKADLVGLRHTGKNGMPPAFIAETAQERQQEEQEKRWEKLTGQVDFDKYPHFAAAGGPDGSRVAIADAQGVRVLDVETGRPVAGPFPHLEVDSLAFSPDGKLLASAGGHTIQLWNLEKGEPRPVYSQSSPAIFRAVDFSLDGRWIAAAVNDGLVQLWDREKARPPQRLGVFRDVSLVSFSPDGQRLFVLTKTRLFRVLLASRQRFASLLEDLPEESMLSFLGLHPHAFSLNGRTLALARGHGVALFSVTTEFPLETPRFVPLPRQDPLALIFRSDGQRLYIGADQGFLVLDTPDLSGHDPDDLLRLADATAGLVVSDNGDLERFPTAPAVLRHLRAKTASAEPGRSTPASLIRWFLSDPWKRTISPLSKVSVDSFLEERMNAGTSEAWDEAAAAFPGHPLLKKLPRPGTGRQKSRSGKSSENPQP